MKALLSIRKLSENSGQRIGPCSEPRMVKKSKALRSRLGSSLGTYDAVIVGGGAIGSTTAYFLQKEGLRVALVDRREVGREASWASAGMIGPCSCSTRNPWFLEATTLSKKLYDELDQRLFEETGQKIGYGGEGELIIIPNQSDVARVELELKSQIGDGVPAKLLSGAEARKQEPLLPEKIAAAVWRPESRFLDARNYTTIVARAARPKGAALLEGWPVNGMLWEGDRVVGVR